MRAQKPHVLTLQLSLGAFLPCQQAAYAFTWQGSANHRIPLALTPPQVFARGQDGAHLGLTPGFLLGPRHQELVRGRAPRHRGNYAGRVLQVR